MPVSYPTEPSPQPGWPASPPPPPGYGSAAPAPSSMPAPMPTAYLPAQPPPPLAPPPAKRGGAATVILAIVSGLLFLASVSLAGLYVVGQNTATDKINQQNTRIDTMVREAATTADKLAKSERDRASAQAKADAADECVSSVRDFFKAVKNDDEPGGQAAVLAIANNCEGVEIV